MTEPARLRNTPTRRLALCIVLLALALARGAWGAPPSEEQWEQSGRPLPEPRFLQPRLDPELRSYTLRADPRPSGRLEVRCTAILADLVKRWSAAFHERYPEVR